MHALAWEDLDNDGKPEIISGKRYYAHSGKDRGAEDEIVIVRYVPNLEQDGKVSFKKEVLSNGQVGGLAHNCSRFESRRVERNCCARNQALIFYGIKERTRKRKNKLFVF